MVVKYYGENKKVQVKDKMLSDVIKEVLDKNGVIKDKYTVDNIQLYLYNFQPYEMMGII